MSTKGRRGCQVVLMEPHEYVHKCMSEKRQLLFFYRTLSSQNKPPLNVERRGVVMSGPLLTASAKFA